MNYMIRKKPGTPTTTPAQETLAGPTPERPRQMMALFKHIMDWRFVKDSVIVGIGSMISRMLGLLFLTLLAHFLTPDDFGFFRYAITLASIITIAANASPTGFARFLAAHADNPPMRDRYYTNGILGLLLLLLASLLISLPALWWLHALNFGTISCVISLGAFYTYLAVARGLNNAWKIGLSYAVSNSALIVSLFVVCGWLRQRNAITATSIYGLTNLVPIVLLEILRPTPFRFQFRAISGKMLLELGRFATPLIVSTAAYTLWSGLDMLLVQNIAPHASGDYAAAKTLSSAFIFVPAATTMVLLPRVAAQSADKSRHYCFGAICMSLLVSLLGVLVVWIGGHKILAIAFGSRYEDAYIPLLVTSIGMAIFSVYVVLEGFVIGRGKPGLPAQALLIALACTAATCYLFTARWGMLGASISFTLGAIMGTAVIVWRSRDLLKRQPPQHPEFVHSLTQEEIIC